MKNLIAILLFLFVVIPGHVSSGEEQKQTRQMSVEDIHKLDSIEKAKESLNALALLADNISKKKYSDCAKVVGKNSICQCLGDNLPVPVSFNLYVRIVTTPKEELGYPKMNQEDKAIVDVTLQAREMCVGK